jgi:hypothetical protein
VRNRREIGLTHPRIHVARASDHPGARCIHAPFGFTGNSMARTKSSIPKRRSNRLQDDVYRAMYLLESRRPGSELGLALALLHAWNEAESLPQLDEVRVWLRQICPLCLDMIEHALKNGSAGSPLLD